MTESRWLCISDDDDYENDGDDIEDEDDDDDDLFEQRIKTDNAVVDNV